MIRNKKFLVTIVLIAVVLLVAVGYAAITAVTLNINGTAKGVGDQSNFSVKFTGTPTKGGKGTTTATITNDTTATINVTGLTAKGDTATATYTISNASPDLSAKLAATVTNSNTTYFDVTTSFGKTTITKGTTTTVTVTVKLKKTPINESATTLTGNITVKLTATPVQPA